VATHAEEAGHGLTLLPQAPGPSWTLRRTGVGFNSFTEIVRGLQRFPHFRLLLGAHALRLEWQGGRRKVSSVLYYDRATGSERRAAGAAVVVAAGPLASTKLLLDSACSDFPEGLGETEGLLGRYLHDHPHDIGTVALDAALPRLGQPAYLTRAPYGESAPLLGAAFTLGSDLALDKILAFTPLKTRRFSFWTFGTMVPAHQNLVRLDPEAKDEFGLPRLDVHIRYDEDVQASMAAARQRLMAILDSAGFRCTVQSSQPKLVPGRSMHYGGTVRMHSSKKHGMLNGWNRLHAVDNVVVADASCFTTGPEKNPTLTVMAIAARAAHRLAEDLRTA
jgi:choline dehydrogenase-like flavoprotein